MIQRAALLLAVALIACGDSKEGSSKQTESSARAPGPGEASAVGTAPSPTAGTGSAPSDPAPANDTSLTESDPPPVVGSIEDLCQRAERCGCPQPGCVDHFENLALPDVIVSCFARQPCESLCDPNAGDVSSPLLTACPNSLAGGGGGGATGKSCTSTRDCPATHDCCSGLCYQQGTSLWQAQCMRPSGSF